MSEPGNQAERHPVIEAVLEERAGDAQLRLADAITKFAGSMLFVYIHIVLFAVWMLAIEASPWPTLTLVVSLEAIFLSTFVMIGQNRQAAFAERKATHEYNEQERELKSNTELSRRIVDIVMQVQHRLAEERGHADQDPPSATDDLRT